jgi:hypothetical protein
MMQPLALVGQTSPFLEHPTRPNSGPSSRMKQYRPGPPVRCRFPCAPGASWAFLHAEKRRPAGDERGTGYTRALAAALSNKSREVIQ